MPVGRPTIDTPTYLGRVVTCDPTQRIIDVVLNASGQRIQVMTTPVCARWPMVGETWTVHFINNTPYLGEPYQQYQIGSNATRTGIEEIPVGDAWINTPTGKLHIIGSPTGSTDWTLIGPPPSAPSGQVLQTNGTGGTFWSGITLSPLTGVTWTNATYQNSWGTSPSCTPAQYYKDPLGYVHLRGRITGGTSATAAFTLPVGFRPGSINDLWPCGAWNGSSPGAAFVDFNSGNPGVCFVYYAAGFTDVGLAGVSFLAEN